MSTEAGPPFLLDAGGDAGIGPRELATHAAAAERDGYDGVLASETKHDPFIALTLAAQATTRVQLASAIAVAFARNPMTVAQSANDLQLISGGRFVLGLGSQVRAHIERRFSMPWSHPAERMAEFIQAVRAIWTAWGEGERLRFRGEYYTHTLMTPFFDPGPNPHGNPPIWLAAVGERMSETAGRVADGLIAHSFTTPTYLREVTLPALRRGAAAAGRDASGVGVSLPAFIAVGETMRELDAAVRATRGQIAFYASTPDYRPVLEAHGWGGLHEHLHRLSVRGDWDAMAEAVPDSVLGEFAAVGAPAGVAAQLRDRFGGVVDRLSFSSPNPVRPATWAALLKALRPPAA